MNSLKNHILISMPHLQDPFFGKSVVLICEHSKDGTMGLIINRPFEEPDLKKIIVKDVDQHNDFLKIVPRVYFGGPVMIERGIFLHSSDYSTEGTIRVSKDFSLTGHKEIIDAISKNEGPEFFRLMLGHAGWSGGQMEREIENGDWLLQNPTKDFVFTTPEEFIWQQATRSFGFEPTDISGVGGRA